MYDGVSAVSFRASRITCVIIADASLLWSDARLFEQRHLAGQVLSLQCDS